MIASEKKRAPKFTQSKGFIIFFIVTLFGIGLYNFMSTRVYSYATIQLGGEQFRARVADTTYKRTRGLSSSEPLKRNDAMLFIFQTSDQYTFWMKDVSYPIDIIWFTHNQIVDIAGRVPPAATDIMSELPTYKPRLPADYVVELPSGTAERLKLKIGDPISEIAD